MTELTAIDATSRTKQIRQQKIVLVVEDNEINSKLLRDLLIAHNHRVLVAENGIESLNLAREHRPDLILMGYPIARYLRPRSHQTLEGR